MMIRMRPYVSISAPNISHDKCSWHDVAPNKVKKSHFPSIGNKNNKEFLSFAADPANNPLGKNKPSTVIFSFGNDRFVNFDDITRPTNRIYCSVGVVTN